MSLLRKLREKIAASLKPSEPEDFDDYEGWCSTCGGLVRASNVGFKADNEVRHQGCAPVNARVPAGAPN